MTSMSTKFPAPMNPQQIAEYIHEEHTPYSQLGFEEGKEHLAKMIQAWADWCVKLNTENPQDIVMNVE